MIVGWDVSTAAIGICVRDDDGKVIEFGVIYPDGDTHAEKHRNAALQVVNFCKRVCPIAKHFVEERLGGFTGGLTTKQTLMALAAMNAIVSFILADFGPVTHIAPVTVNRITGFKKPKGAERKPEVVKFVRIRETSFPYRETTLGNLAKGVSDMADAWMLAEAGTKISKGVASIGQPKKVARGDSKTGPAKTRSKAKRGIRVPLPESEV